MMKKESLWAKCKWSVLSLLFLGGLWSVFSHPIFLPSPYAVIARVLSSSIFFHHMLITFQEMIGAMFFALVISLPLAYLMEKKPSIRSFMESFFLLFQCLPMFMLAPIMILLFGWSYLSILIPTCLMLLFPMTINIYRGLSSTPKEYCDYFLLHGMSQKKFFLHVKLPFALPQLFSGLRITSGISGIGVIAGEWAGGQEGLGVFIQECRRNFDMEALFGAIFLVFILTSGMFLFFHFLEILVKGKKRYEMV